MKWLWLCGLALVPSLFALTYFANRSAFCTSEWRFLNEQELIDAAIADEIEPEHLESTFKSGTSIDGQYVAYQGVAEFKEHNPNCCRILTGDEERETLHMYGFISRLNGEYATGVHLNYNLKYIDSKGAGNKRPTQSTVPVSSCGLVVLEALRGG